MKNKLLILFVLMAVVVFSSISLAHAAAGTPPSGPGMGNGTPPGAPDQDTGNGTLKERLQEFYDAKGAYIEQKRQCKEESARTNAPSGTCWDKLKPMMLRLLLREVNITASRVGQLREQNITIPNIEDVNAQLKTAHDVFADSGSSKYLIKSTAKDLEDLINEIEEIALQNQSAKLIEQMDKLMIKADAITAKLEAKLIELKDAGVRVNELEKSLEDYKAEVVKTKASIADAKAKYAQMATSSELNLLAKDVRTFIDNANHYLVKAFDKAKAMLPDMKNSEGGGPNNSPGNGGDNQPPGAGDNQPSGGETE